MKILIFAVLITVPVVILGGPVTSPGSDDWECMFCHQYPGLVMPGAAGNFKLLSIDRDRYFASPHGKAACRACHNRIDSVPHTGATEVACTTGCHAEDREEIESMDLSSYRVHRDDHRSVAEIEDRSSCRACHPLYPHSRNLKVRAILNMHMGYMLGGPSHMKKDGPDNISYDWKTPEKASFTGEPYGRFTKIEPPERNAAWNYICNLYRRLFYGKDTPDDAGRPVYMISRIAVFSGKDGGRTLLIDTEDPVRTAEYKAGETAMSEAEKEREMKYFHKDITEQEFSVAFNGCHSAGGMLDFKQLGYRDRKAQELRDMDVKRLETEYKIFHFPHMLK